MTAINEVKKRRIQEDKTESVIEKSANDILHLTMCSDLRRGLFLTLNEGGKSLSDLREALDVSSTTAIHALRMLEKAHLTTQDAERNYVLTNTGKIMAQKLIYMSDTAETVAKFEEFWLEHDISGIPKPLLTNIGFLRDSLLLTSVATDIFKVYTTFINLVAKSKTIKGISPIFIPDYTTIFTELVAHGADVELIVTGEVLEKVLETADQAELQRSLSDNLTLYVLRENPKIAFTSGDDFISLGLFRFDGTYDYSDDLISYSRDAIEWGGELFNYYVESAERITL